MSARGRIAWATTLLAAVAGIAATAPAAPAAPGGPPNVIVVMTDDVTYDQMQLMPNFRRLERMGATFTNAFASYPLCCPARATFLTGQYAHNHGVKSNFYSTGGGFEGLEGQDNTLPVWLQDAGYETAFVGKYLNEYGGRDRELIPPGWNDWNGLIDYSTYNYFNWAINRNGKVEYHGDRDYIESLIELAEATSTDRADSPTQGLAMGVEIFDPVEDFGSEDQEDYQVDATGRIADESLAQLAEGEDPFFLYYAPIAAHRETDYEEVGGIRDVPLTTDPRPPERYEDTYDDVELPRDPSFDEADVSDKPKTVNGRASLDAETIDRIERDNRGALGALRAADDGVGNLLDTLEEAGKLEDTIVVYTTDQGFMQGQHRIDDHKYIPYEPSIHIPLAMAGPGIPAGEKVTDLVAAQDITATIVDAAGAEAGRELDGVSLLPSLEGSEPLPQRDILLEALAPIVEFEIGNEAIDAQVPYYGLRTERYKYIDWSFGDEELYDLREDPYELENLADDPELAGVKERLAARAEALRACAGEECVKPGSAPAAQVEPPIEQTDAGQAMAFTVLAALFVALAAGGVRLYRTVRS